MSKGWGTPTRSARSASSFTCTRLALEDVVNTHQRPKAEPYQGCLFIVARMARLNERLETEQISLFLGPNFVITFLEDPGDAFDSVRQHLRNSQGRLRCSGAGYLAYALLDAVVDGYFPVVEEYGERLDALEDEVVSRSEPVDDRLGAPGQTRLAYRCAARSGRCARRSMHWPATSTS